MVEPVEPQPRDIDSPGLLVNGQVQLWYFDLDQASSQQAIWMNCLSDDEVERAERFRFDLHRRRFIAGRGLMRYILASYLDVDAADLEFSYDNYDRPGIRRPENMADITFSVSNSQHLGLIGLTLNDELGVDLEQIRPIEDSARIIDDQFPAEEQRVFFALPEARRLNHFYALWTCKEAYLKAKGLGLSGDLKSFVVTDVEHSPRLLSSTIDQRDPVRWRFHTPQVAPGFVCSLATSNSASHVVCDQWPVQ